MREPHDYIVTVESGPEGPDAKLAERFAVIAAFRLRSLDRRLGHYPEASAWFDMLDGLEGKYLWEMSDAEVAENPPTRIDFEVLSVDPVVPPTEPGVVRVTVRVPG